MIRSTVLFKLLFPSLLLWSAVARAEGPLLQDRNGDGTIELIAFGDSITYGVGDGIEPGQYISQLGEVGKPGGYPLRLSSLLPTSVLNAGVPGEMVVGVPEGRTPGVVRFPEVVVGSSADLVVILEGANDAQFEISAAEFATSLQKMINVARADNKNVALATLLPPTVQHGIFAPQTALYSGVIRQLAALNEVTVIDLEQGFLTDCPDLSVCPYYNLPEGLHPNTVGYDAIAKMVATKLQS
jgi:lysophospholipase L1-like esterase